MLKFLPSFALLLLGLAVAAVGGYLFFTAARLDAQSTKGIASLALFVTGLLLVGISGGVWRSGGGVWRRKRRWDP